MRCSTIRRSATSAWRPMSTIPSSAISRLSISRSSSAAPRATSATRRRSGGSTPTRCCARSATTTRQLPACAGAKACNTAALLRARLMENAMETGTERMIARKDGAVGWMTFNNPARHNAVSVGMWQAVPNILDAFARDEAIRVVVLSGAGGKAFVSGADISEFGERRASREATIEYNRIADRAHQAIVECKKPTIAMIQGYCIGGGLAVALACDLRI